MSIWLFLMRQKFLPIKWLLTTSPQNPLKISDMTFASSVRTHPFMIVTIHKISDKTKLNLTLDEY